MTRAAAGAALVLAALLGSPAAAQDSARARVASGRRAPLPDDTFRLAIFRDPTNARFQLEFGRWYRRQSQPWLRMQAGGHFRAAARLADAQGSLGIMADAEYEQARTAWTYYERFARTYQLVGDAPGFSVQESLAEWRYVENFFEHEARPMEPDRGEAEYLGTEEHARAALAAEPGHLGATGLLAVLLGDHRRWEEALTPAREAIRAHPASPEGYRILGLALQESGRTAEAARAFAGAVSRMSPEQRGPYDNLGLILRHADQSHYDSLPADQQSELRRLYWALAQPLALDSINPVQVEFYARVTYVDLRWTVPEEHLVGWQSDRGLTWLRYGPPDVWATMAGGFTDSNFLTIWVYPRNRTRFVFQGMASYSRATLYDDYAWMSEQVREAAPARFENLRVVAEMDTIATQVAQFAGPAGSTTLAVFGFVPVGRMLRGVDLRNADFEIGAIVKDQRMRDVTRRVLRERVTVADSLQLETRSWRLDLSPSEYLLRLEARESATQRAARALAQVGVEEFGPGNLKLSDVVMADRVEPRDSAPRRWTDYLIDPNVGVFRVGAPVALLWETYNLRADSAGVARFRVEVRVSVRAIERRMFLARFFGGLGDAMGATPMGDAQVSLTYERAVPLGDRGAFPQNLRIELVGAPRGTYSLELAVTDLLSGQAAKRRRQFIVTGRPEPMAARER